jgi:large subunit ribosomal protein L9
MNVQVILREDVTNLGQTGDVVKVRAGFARNYLLPRKLAVEANPRNLREFEHHKRLAVMHGASRSSGARFCWLSRSNNSATLSLRSSSMPR